MTACGVWPTSRGLAAVLIDSTGRLRSFSLADSDDARWGLSLRLAAVGADRVLGGAPGIQPDRLPRPPRRHHRLDRGPAGRSVPPLRRRHHPQGARPSAAQLARLPAIPWLRSLLRRLQPPDERQPTLLYAIPRPRGPRPLTAPGASLSPRSPQDRAPQRAKGETGLPQTRQEL